MARYCVCCKKQPIPHDNTRSFHRFPNDSKRLKQWMKITGVSKVTKNYTVCSDHFDPSSYHQTDGYTTVRRLLSNAVPIQNTHKNECSADEDTTDIPSTRNTSENGYKSIITINTNEVDGHISVQSALNTMENRNDNNSKIGRSIDQDISIDSYMIDVESQRILKLIQDRHLKKKVCFKEGFQSHTISREDFVTDAAWHKFFIYTKYKNSQVNAERKKSWRRKSKVSTTEFVRCSGEEDGLTEYVEMNIGDNKDGTENEIEDCKQEDVLNTDSHIQVDKMCRICLTTGGRSWNLLEHNLSEMYQNVSGLPVSGGDGRPRRACWECGARLRQAAAFRDQAVRAHAIFTNLLSDTDITNRLAKLDRRKLQSTLEKTKTAIYSTSENCNGTQDDFHPDDCSPIEEFNSDDGESLIQTNVNDDHSIDNNITTNDELKVDNVKNVESKREKVKMKSKSKKNKKTTTKSKLTKNHDKTYNNTFILTKLNFDQQVAEFEKRKYRQCYLTAQFKCEKCYRGFSSGEQLQHHALRHTDRYGKYECQICKMHYSSNWSRYTSHKHSELVYNCTKCNFVTNRDTAAMNHMKYHSGKTYTCPHCDAVFNFHTTYMSHLRIKHPSDILCQVCGRSYVSQQGLVLHKKIMHRLFDEKLLESGPACGECDIKFASQQAYLTHLSISPKHPASNKDKTVIRRRRRNNIKGGEANIQCELCEVVVASSGEYYRHFRGAHPGKNRTRYPPPGLPHMCHVCGQMMHSSALLRDHMSQHSGARFPCGACGKQFARESRLRAHERRHRARRLPCPTCGNSYTCIGNLQRHMVVHTGERPYKCEICGKAFGDYNVKKAHVDCVHLKKPWPKRNKDRRRQAVSSLPADNETERPTDYQEIPVT